MILSVNPNRMELLRLKRRLELARRGYKLLKDKRDALIQRFISLVYEYKKTREEFEEKLKKCMNDFLIATLSMGDDELNSVFQFPQRETKVKTMYQNVMSVKVPKYEIIEEGNLYTYGMIQTSPEIDNALKKYQEILPLMVKMAQLDKTIVLLTEEIEKTRRRVNALEYVMIPNLEDTIKFITMKLDEMARSSNSSLMRIKELIRAE
ncbi:MAG: V-type ATP synthase subunit D [Atribacteria bacterium 34_868]|nr:MAG: V-type ATP synthase subunit D [Atribacteria bacterium 34_128]KUK98579.1 MAG: V-type ATP synthase subunit D [Atribacteria bacterium 34_868]MBP8717757.1 V-type ATP synthase subunit D [Candidatus Atribacteria bacterium]MDD5496878.1 V-type ATP synthase subunit D [Atribacterota bacterium]